MPVGVRRAFFIKTFCFCAPAIKVFVHALSARPLKNGWRGRESNMYADGIKCVFSASAAGVLGLYLVGVGASTTREVGANIVRPRRYLKKLFFYRTFV